MSRAFTLIEMLLATMLVGVLTTLSVLTFLAVTHGWQSSTDYLDKMQRTDYALNQLIVALRSAYYPEAEDPDYCFYDPYEREGDRPSDSDIIEWTKKGNALIGSNDALSEGVHKVRVMVLEEGDREDGDDDKFPKFRFSEPIKKTGLYARAFVDPALASKSDTSVKGRQIEYQQPTLISDGVVGFRCRTVKELPTTGNGLMGQNGAYEKDKLEDKYEEGKFPYKVELTLFIEKRDDNFLSRKEKQTIVRTIRIPVYEQSQDPK